MAIVSARARMAQDRARNIVADSDIDSPKKDTMNSEPEWRRQKKPQATMQIISTRFC